MLILSSLVALTAEARADEEVNWLVGPVLGIRLGSPAAGSRAIYGIEGGAGWGPERINVGVTRRLDTTFAYVELDPWYIVGASLGFGFTSDGQSFPVIGAWEGVPLKYPDCAGPGLHDAVTLAGGYRWTGVHELYVTVKAGGAPSFCTH
jgi:hypothetical protein